MPTTVFQVERYGYRRDRLDPRDLIFNDLSEVLPETAVPKQADLEREMPPIYDQAQLGSCTANATGAIMQHAQMKQGEAEGANIPSRLFIYYQERVHGGYPVGEDTGAEVRDGLWVLANDGAPAERDWPYDTDRFAEHPPPLAYTDALRYEAVQYQKILLGHSRGVPMRTAVHNRLPIAFGFPVPGMFEDLNWDPAKQYLPLPDAKTQWIGGHAVVVVGYDWTMTRFNVPVFKVRNSWGADWGERGHFYMDYRWFTPGRQLAADLWVVQKASA